MSNAFAMVLILSAIGGALGVAVTRGPAWQGGVVGVAAAFAYIGAVMAGVSSPLLLYLVAIIAAGIVGGSLKLSKRQLPAAGLGALIGFFIATAIITG